MSKTSSRVMGLMVSISFLSFARAAVIPAGEQDLVIAAHPSSGELPAKTLAEIDLLAEPAAKASAPDVASSRFEEKATGESQVSKPIQVKTRDWGTKYNAVAAVYGQVQQDRASLKALRGANIARLQEVSAQDNPNYSELMQTITEQTKDYIRTILAEEVAKLGAAPCQFSVMSMGSMAREESGFFTDLEIAFLLEKNSPEAQRYFSKLSQRLADRIYLLGEHPSVGGKGLRVDEADNSPIHLTFANRYADPTQVKERLMSAIKNREFNKIPVEGDRLMIASVEEFARYSSPFYIDELKNQNRQELRELRRKLTRKIFFKNLYNRANRHLSKKEIYENAVRWVDQMVRPYTGKEQKHIEDLSSLTRNTVHLFGDKAVYNTYLQKREAILADSPKNHRSMVENRRQEIARDKILDDLKKYEADVDGFLAQNKVGEKIDLKRQFYRLPEQILTNLSFYYNSPTQNTLGIASFLEQKGIMGQELAQDVQDLMNFSMGLRLKKQSRLGKQGYAIYLDQEAFEKDLKKLTTELNGLEKVKNLLIKAGEDASAIEKVDNKMIELRHKIDEHNKVAPGLIIDEQDIQLMNEKYIPILQRLYHACIEWVSGKLNAFKA
ncbi:DUF294 nucleotidyltransferase-like domain-containing protein [Candidatus Odyssella thessalonicensis]|uniref:DUF294 nucleotidyltransferase-like domain-containing protein n=1 Tax=Candidatus Odyssella thessalonicensis TaxID=84647 RepID=UPI000225B221|nr:DUF294 nucleotidyltransferase-like domain-containing protein [Candidatus Odyssella thessalonicensis]